MASKLSGKEESFEPGLLSLSLNIMHVADVETMNDRKSYLRKAIEMENKVVHNVLNTLIDIIDYRQPRKREEALMRMEKRFEENRYHLNTIADLEKLYKDLHRFRDADEMKKMKADILCEKGHNLEKAQFLFEQGYAVLFEDSIDSESVSNLKLQGVNKVLQAEIKSANGYRKDMLLKTQQYVNLARKALSCAMECERKEESHERKEDSVRRICRGLEILKRCLNTEHLEHIWKFYLGMAYNRLCDSLNRAPNQKDEERMVTNKAVDIFWQVIQQRNNPEFKKKDKLYVARSYAYIGHILSVPRRKSMVESDTSTGFENNKDFLTLLANPLEAFKLAYDIEKFDEVVLNRYGKSVWNMSWDERDPEKKLGMLKEAYDLFTKSIEFQNSSNWFAYANKMGVCEFLAALSTGDEKRKYLEEARTNGVYCYHTKHTPRDIVTLAKICQQLAKFPDCRETGVEFVKDTSYLHEAISYLNVAVELGGMTNYHLCVTFGLCLFEIKEYRSAIEWMKRGMSLSNTTSFYAFNYVCIILLQHYRDMKASGNGKAEDLLAELFFVIQEARRKYAEQNQKLLEEIKILFERQPALFEYFSFLVSKGRNPEVFEQIKEIAGVCLQAKVCMDVLLLEQLQSDFRQLEIDNESQAEKEDNDILTFEPKSFEENGQQSTRHYKYDFFVVHSSQDAGWVYSFLLQQLEHKLHDNDSAFRGCIDRRDFMPGKKITANIMEAMEKSFKIFLVLTPNFVKSEWCHFETDHALVKSIQEKERKDCVVPILLFDCKIPKSIEHLNFVNLTDHSQLHYEIPKLKRVLLPDI